MKKVYSHELLPMAGYIQSLLENNGIACMVKNQNLSGALGEIPPIECWPEVWIHEDHDYSNAMGLIDAVNTHDSDELGEWNCQCGEENSAEFFSCWNCGIERAITVT